MGLRFALVGDQHVFVNWPGDDDPQWRDTRQGGLFALLAYRLDPALDRITVDVDARLYSPTMPTRTALAHQLWAAPDLGGPVQWSHSLRPWNEPLRAVVYLGSTPRSLVHVDTGEPFQVCRRHLTMTGDSVAHVLDYEYRFSGDILTFSGRPQRHRRWTWG